MSKPREFYISGHESGQDVQIVDFMQRGFVPTKAYIHVREVINPETEPRQFFLTRMEMVNALKEMEGKNVGGYIFLKVPIPISNPEGTKDE